MKLIPLSDFVLDQLEIKQSTSEFKEAVRNYTHFLKQPLALGMLVPVDDAGNVLEEPYFDGINKVYYTHAKYWYEEAKEKVLFEGFEIAGKVETTYFLRHNSGEIIIYYGEEEKLNIEGLLSPRYEIELTPSALEAIGIKE